MTHLTADQLQILRSDLVERRRRLLSREERTEDAALEALDSGDEAAEAQEKLEEETLDQVESSELVEIEAALNRIEAGTYGVDEETGMPIAYERLLIMPTARKNV